MSRQPVVDNAHSDIFELLPWYANHTLTVEQEELVSRHLSKCALCQEELQFLRSLHNDIDDDATNQYIAHSDVENSLADVLNRIDSEQEGRPATETWFSRLKSTIREQSWFSSWAPDPRWAATAMAGVLVAGVGMMMFVNSPNDDFTVLSSPDVGSESIQLMVDVVAGNNTEAAVSTISAELERFDVGFEIEKTSDSELILAIDDEISVSDMNDLISKLESNSVIDKVSISSLP